MSAVFSPCGQYRYHLGRTVSLLGRGRVVFAMCNPSVADAEINDPTVERCCRFAERWGFRDLDVVNIFAYRSTDPKALREVTDPIGPENDRWILETCRSADRVVCAWGGHGKFLGRGDAVLGMLRAGGITPYALRKTKTGAPQHPLYLPGDLDPFPIEVPFAEQAGPSCAPITRVLVTVAIDVGAPKVDPLNHAVGIVTRQGFAAIEARKVEVTSEHPVSFDLAADNGAREFTGEATMPVGEQTEVSR